MLNIVLAIHLILAVLLIVVVLMQRSEGGGLGIGGGGNNSKSASLGKLDGLQRATWSLGAAFFVTSIVLTLMAARDSGNNSLLDQLDGLNASEIVNETSENQETSSEVPADPNSATEETNIPADPNAQ